MWTVNAANKTVVNKLTNQCLTLHAAGMHNVGVSPCSGDKEALQSWLFEPSLIPTSSVAVASTATTGQIVLSPPSSAPALWGPNRKGPNRKGPNKSIKSMCLARTNDVKPGQTEVWAGPLDGGDVVVLVFNRNLTSSTSITALWSDIGVKDSDKMEVTDLWSHQDLGVFIHNFTATGVEVHGSRVFRLTKA
jgi:hypothetical protein